MFPLLPALVKEPVPLNSNIIKLKILSIVFPPIQLHGIDKTRICNDLYRQALHASNNLRHLNNVTWFLAILYTMARNIFLFGICGKMSLNVAVSRMG
jgi:hypothetical protein